MIVGSLLLILVAVGLLVAGVLSGSNALIVCSIIVIVLAAIVLVLGVKQAAASGDAYDDDDADDEPAEMLTSEYPAVSDNGFRVRQSERRRSDTDETTAVGLTSRRGSRAAAAGTTTADLLSDRTTDHGQMIVDEQVRGIPAQGSPSYDAPAAPVYSAPAFEGFDTAATDASARQAPAYEAHAPAFDAPAPAFDAPAPAFDAPAPAFDAPAPAYDAEFIDAGESDLDEDPPDEPSAQMVTPANAARVAMLTNDVLVVDGRPRYHVLGCVHLHARESEPLPVGEAVELGFTPCGLCEPDSALLADARRV